MKNRNQILDYLREITIVVIGVLIAVSVGNFKERLDNKKYLRNMLTAIENEITISQSEIDSVLSRHLVLYEKLEREFDQNEKTLAEFIASSGGFQVATVKNLSLRFFISNKAELLKFEMISQLMDIELKASMMSDKVDRLTNYVYDSIDKSDEKTFMKFAYLMSEVIDSEQSLLDSYSAFLKENHLDLQNKNE